MTVRRPEVGAPAVGGTPVAHLLCGPSLAGKSTVAARIARATGAALLSADGVNAERGLPFGAEGLPESVWAESLRILLERLRGHARSGQSVVVDDTQCYRWLRDRYRAECVAGGLEAILLLVSVPQHVLYERHARLMSSGDRLVLSQARLADHLARFEWPSDDEHALDVSSERALDAYLAAQRRPISPREA